MQLDSLMICHLVNELNQQLIGAQIREIHQTDDRMFEIELFRADAKPMHLLLCAYTPTYLCVLSHKRKNTNFIPSQTFCMSMRKHLEGSRIASVTQINMDRIVRIEFNRIEDGSAIVSRYLYCELLPSAPNIILTQDGTILDACIHSRKEDRTVLPQVEYTLPKNSGRMNFMEFSEAELRNVLDYPSTEDDDTAPSVLFHLFNGLNRQVVEKICAVANIGYDDLYSTLTGEGKDKLAHALYNVAQEIADTTGLYLYTDASVRVSRSAIPLSDSLPYTHVSVNDWIYQEVSSSGGVIAAAVKDLEKQIHSAWKKELRKERKIREEMNETAKMEEYKLWGNLLSINAWQKVPHEKSITVSNLFVDPPVDITIPLNPEMNLSSNSQLYFKKYNKLKKRKEIGAEKIKECQQMQEYLNNLAFFAADVKDRKALDALKEELKAAGIHKQEARRPGHKKNSWNPELATVTVDGFTIYIGRNNVQNEYLTLHKADKQDIWFHAQKIPGSHVVIHRQDAREEIPENVLLHAARLAAKHSQGRDSGKVSVDYTLIKYVKKIPQGPPGLVNYSHQKTLVVTPETEQ